MFPMRAQKLYEFYRRYDSIEEIPNEERDKIEKQVFRQPLTKIWGADRSFLSGMILNKWSGLKIIPNEKWL